MDEGPKRKIFIGFGVAGVVSFFIWIVVYVILYNNTTPDDTQTISGTVEEADDEEADNIQDVPAILLARVKEQIHELDDCTPEVFGMFAY